MTARPKRDTRERQPGETDEQFYMRVLPRPPLTMAAHDGTIAGWLEDVYSAGGIRAIEWVFETHNWPLGDIARGRMLHFLGVLRERATAQARRRAEQAAEDAQAEDERRRRQQRRDAGWA
jgi:hypothetical protein